MGVEILSCLRYLSYCKHRLWEFELLEKGGVRVEFPVSDSELHFRDAEEYPYNN